MEKLTLRSDKGSPLTHTEMDKNFTYPFSKATFFEMPTSNTEEMTLKINGLTKPCMVEIFYITDEIITREKISILTLGSNFRAKYGIKKGYIYHDESASPQIVPDTISPVHPVSNPINILAEHNGQITSAKIKLFGFADDFFLDEVTIYSDFITSRFAISKHANQNAVITPLYLIGSENISSCTFTYESGFLCANITFSSAMAGFNFNFFIRTLNAQYIKYPPNPILQVIS